MGFLTARKIETEMRNRALQPQQPPPTDLSGLGGKFARLEDTAQKYNPVNVVSDLIIPDNKYERAFKGGKIETQAISGSALRWLGSEVDSSAVKTFAEGYRQEQLKELESRGLQPTGQENIVEKTVRSTPNTLAALATTLLVGVATKNPMAARVTGGLSTGALEGGAAYQEALDRGATEDQAKVAARITGSINGAIEVAIPWNIINTTIGKVLPKSVMGEAKKTLAKSVVDYVLKSGKTAVGEGAQEYVQKIVSNLSAKYAYDPKQSWDENALESGKVGALMGLVFSLIPGAGGNQLHVQKSKTEEIQPELIPEKQTVEEAKPTEKIVNPAEDFKSIIKYIPKAQLPILTEAVSRPMSAEAVTSLNPQERAVIGVALNTAKQLPNADLVTIQKNIQMIQDTGVTIPTTKVEPVKVEKTPVEKPVLASEKPVTKKEVREEVKKAIEETPKSQPLQEGAIQEARKGEKFYHQTNADFNKFNSKDIAFFSSEKKLPTYGKNTMEVELDYKKPYEAGFWLPESELRAKIPALKKQGYDSAIYRGTPDDMNKIRDVVVFNPKKQAKIIPKSQPLQEGGKIKTISEKHMMSQAGAEVYQQLETAKAGKRMTIKQPQNVGPSETVGNIGEKSSFPTWIPKELRSRKLFDKIQDSMLNGTMPKGKKALELYELVRQEILSRNDTKFQSKENPKLAALKDSYKRLQQAYDNAPNQQARTRLNKAMHAIQKQLSKYQEKGGKEKTIDKKTALSIQDLLLNPRAVKNVFQEKLLMPDGGEAWGMQIKDIIGYANNPIEATPSHESFHFILENFLTESERKSLFDEGRSLLKNDKLTDLQVEEKLAGNFSKFVKDYITLNKKGAKVSLKNKLILLFKKIWERLKEFANLHSEIRKLQIDAMLGKFRTIQGKYENLGMEYNINSKDLGIKFQEKLSTEKGRVVSAEKVFQSAWKKLYGEEAPGKLTDLLNRPADKELIEKGNRMVFQEGKNVQKVRSQAEKQVTREKNAEKVREIKLTLKKMFKAKTATTQQIKTQAVNYIKANLPTKIQGQYLNAVKNAKTAKNLQKILDSVDKKRSQYERSKLVNSINDVAENIKNLPVDLQRTIIKITSEIELKKHTKKLLNRLNKTQEFLDTKGKDVEMPRRVLNELGILKRTPFEQLSTMQLIDINNRLQQYNLVGRNIMKDKIVLEKKGLEDNLALLEKGSVNIDKIDPERKLNPFESDKITNTEKLKDRLSRLDLSLIGVDRLFNRLDGRADYTGPNFRLFKEPVDAKWNSWKYAENKISMALYQMLNTLKMTEKNSERIAIHAYREQRGGLKKLLEDRKLTQKQIDSVKLDEKEMAVYNFMRRNLDDLHAKLTEKMEKENNVMLGKQENYFPMMTDYGVTKPLIEEFQAENRLKSVPFGSIKERQENARQTLKLDAFQTFNSYVGKSTYFIEMDALIQKLSRMAGSDRYRKAVGENAQRTVLTWLDVLARKGGAITREADWTRVINDLNNNLSVAILGLRITSTLKQPLALLDGAAEIGAYAFKGIPDAVNEEWEMFMNENSSEIRERFADPFLEEISHDKTLSKTKHVAMYPLKFMDNLTARAVWAGAYTKKMDELDLKIDFKNPNKEALKYSDLIVRKTQASSAFKDLPTMMTGKNRQGAKLIMKFQTFVLNRWSYIREDLPDKMKHNKAKAVQQITWLALAMFLEGSINSVYYSMMHGSDDEDDKESKISIILRSMAASVIQTVPFIGQMFSSVNYGTNPVPLIAIVDKFFNSIGQVFTAKKAETKTKHAIRALSTGIGVWKGIPTDQARQILESILFPAKDTSSKSRFNQ